MLNPHINFICSDVVIQLANHMQISQFSLIGQSVGAVFALAVAKKYPSRIIGTVHLISPWVPTAAANTFRWTKRLPGGLMTRTLSLGMDAMWTISKATNSSSAGWLSVSGALSVDDSQRSSSESAGHSRHSSMSGKFSSAASPTSATFHTALVALEEDELLASLDDDYVDIPTDFPPHRPLRHMVRLQQMSLFLSMNKMRMAEPSSEGQTNDVLVALEKYHPFGFSFSDVDVPVSVVWGDKDNLIPLKGIEWMASVMKDIRVKVLEGEAHDLVWKEGVIEWAIRGILGPRTLINSEQVPEPKH
jgi:pimeloyl-ACP methyl ester carboxylesterase